VVPDAHCHLDQLADPDRAVEEAAADGVGPILAVSMDAASAEVILALRARHPGRVLAGVGLHPSRIPEISAGDQERELRRLEALLDDADVVGEIGLDYKDATTVETRARQGDALARQMEWAAARGLPVNLHSRRADRDVLDAAIAFHEKTGLGALMHWFTHSAKLARRCAAHGVFISPGPLVLVDPRTREVAAAIEPSILLVETDAPVVYGGEGAARPAWARRVLVRLERERTADPAPLESILEKNFQVYLARGAGSSTPPPGPR
jgi:TatD DNase family protein